LTTTTRITEATNERTQLPLATHLRVADGMFSRMRGLLGAPEPQPAEGLLLVPCSGVHMFGMRYALDVVFLDRDNRVVRLAPKLRPQRMIPWVRHAHQALELPVGAIEASDTRVGDTILLR
jgi:uncharacterized protein